MRILGIPGSLRRGSWNRGLLWAAQQEAPAGVEIAIHEIGDVPLYNQDLDGPSPPAPVAALRQAIAEAEALLLASPEYNYNVPGVLKNAIDWASRPAPDSCLRYKPVAIMSASVGHFGGIRAQLGWRQVFLFTESYVLLKPEVAVYDSAGRFDADGNLTDESTRALVRSQVEALVAWAGRVRRGE